MTMDSGLIIMTLCDYVMQPIHPLHVMLLYDYDIILIAISIKKFYVV